MSARRIQKVRNSDPKMTRIQHNRYDAVTRKREERAVREQYKRERKIESYLADDENFPSFSAQLGKLGLQLRDIPGDGYVSIDSLNKINPGSCINTCINTCTTWCYILLLFLTLILN